MSFEQAFTVVIDIEGGYVNDPRDPGGETKYGISARSYPSENIEGMTIERAMQIYRVDFWDRCRCDELPDIVAECLFDSAVHSGVETAIRWMQKAAGVAADGVLGPITLEAVWRYPAALICARMYGARLSGMTDLARWSTYGRGWSRRVARGLMSMPLVAGDPGTGEAAPPGSLWVERPPAGLEDLVAWLAEHPGLIARRLQP